MPPARPRPSTWADEQGFTVITKVLRIPSGGSSTIRFELEGRVEPTRGSYRLEVGHQPTATPDEVNVRVAGAGGWEVATPADGSRDGPARRSPSASLPAARALEQLPKPPDVAEWLDF